MDYHVIKLNEMPKIEFAHVYQTTINTWDLTYAPNLVEITFIETGNFKIVRSDGFSKSFKAPCVFSFVHNTPYKMVIEADFHRHYTFAFCASEKPSFMTENETNRYSLLTKGDELSGYSIPLPEYIPSGASFDKIIRSIKQIVAGNSTIVIPEKLKVIKYVFDVLSEMSKYCLEHARPSDSSGFISVYSTKTIKYISENIKEKICVQDIADSLNISYGYLSRVFRDDIGITIVQYINEAKVKRMEELLKAKDLTLEEAGQCVGLYDAKYTSRIFKKYSGMTFSEYKKSL